MSIDVRDIRRANLTKRVKQAATIVAFAREHDLDTTYLSQIINGHRAMGEKSARNLESKLGLPKGALDCEDSESGQPPDDWPIGERRGDFTRLPPRKPPLTWQVLCDLIASSTEEVIKMKEPYQVVMGKPLKGLCQAGEILTVDPTQAEPREDGKYYLVVIEGRPEVVRALWADGQWRLGFPATQTHERPLDDRPPSAWLGRITEVTTKI